MAVYEPSGSGNVHVDKVNKKVSIGFPKGKKKVVKKKGGKNGLAEKS